MTETTDIERFTAEVREAYQMTGDGLDFKSAARERGLWFDRWLADIQAEARNEALREAAKTARTTPLTLDDIDYEAQVIAEAILELVKEEA